MIQHLLLLTILVSEIEKQAAPVWSTNSSESNIGKIQHAQNEELRIVTGSHKMSCIDHLHRDAKVEDHLNLLFAQYLENVLSPHHHHGTYTTGMKETLLTRHSHTVLPLLAITKIHYRQF